MSKTVSYPVDEIIESALLRIGGETSSATEQQSARRNLNALLRELIARNAPLGYMKEYSVSVGTSVSRISTNTGVMGILEASVEVSGVSTPLSPISYIQYFQLPNRDQSGKPSYYSAITSADSLEIALYPINDTTHRTVRYLTITRPDTIVNNRQSLDISPLYYNALVAGLAYYMSFERRSIDLNYRAQLKQEYDSALQIALDFERERVSIYIQPRSRR